MGFFLLLACLLWVACQPAESHSRLFREVFGEDAAHFRGVTLGESLAQVREKETGRPYRDDAFGLEYRLNVGTERPATVEYMSRTGEERLVESIVLNLRLEDEGETSRLYSEIESHLRNRHGVPQGNLGNLLWEDEDQGVQAILRLLDDKKGISLNFAPLAEF